MWRLLSDRAARRSLRAAPVAGLAGPHRRGDKWQARSVAGDIVRGLITVVAVRMLAGSGTGCPGAGPPAAGYALVNEGGVSIGTKAQQPGGEIGGERAKLAAELAGYAEPLS